MRRFIVVSIIAILLVGCTPKPSVVVDTSATLVAATIAAWETSIVSLQSQPQTSTSTPTQQLTSAPVPTITLSPTAVVEVTPTFPPGNCNETWARLVISQLKDIDEPDEENGQETPSLSENTPLTEEQRLLIIAASEIRIAKITLLPVPSCLERAKELKLATYEGIKKLFSGEISENEVISTLMAAGAASQEADAEIARIEACFQTGCD
ncbi:MAG: hypothetical protein WBI14_01135 [Anaerolineaceae bacterium]